LWSWLFADWIRAIGRAIVISRTKTWQDDADDDDAKPVKQMQ